MKQDLINLVDSQINYLPKLIQATEDIAGKIQAGREGEAFRILNNYFGGMMWIIDGIKAIQNAKNGYLNNIDIKLLNKKLNELEESFKNEDFVLFSDILDYELKEDLTIFLDEIIKLKEEMADE